MRFFSSLVIMGFLLSVSSVYLNHIVFADDSWSDIVKRQQSSQQKALETYQEKYAFSNMNNSKGNWEGLTSTATDETSKGRNIEAQQQVSLQNAVAQFDIIHIAQLDNLTANGYKGISSTPTDTQGRDRNVLIDNARASSIIQAQDILNQLEKIQQNYGNLRVNTTTDSVATYDRQTRITKNMADAEAQAADLVSKLAKIDNVYIDLNKYVGTNIPYTYKSGSITNEVTQGGRNIPTESAYALEKAVMIFNEIHDKHITELQSNYYGLTSTPTDSQGRDRNLLIENAREVSITNAMRVYNSNYGSVDQK